MLYNFKHPAGRSRFDIDLEITEGFLRSRTCPASTGCTPNLKAESTY